jgi:elongation factor G
MGSAFKNKGVQLLLDGVSRYLPSPTDVVNRALALDENEASFQLPCSPSGPFVGLAFKLEEGRWVNHFIIRLIILSTNLYPLLQGVALEADK